MARVHTWCHASRTTGFVQKARRNGSSAIRCPLRQRNGDDLLDQEDRFDQGLPERASARDIALPSSLATTSLSEEIMTAHDPYCTATDLARAIRAREISAREVVRSHIERLDALNPKIN